MTNRVERDRHYSCSAASCTAPPGRLRGSQKPGACTPRRVWWFRTKNSAGRRVSISFRSEAEALEAGKKVEAARILGQDYTPKSVAAPSIPTFREVAVKAMDQYASLNSLAHATVLNHHSYISTHLLPYFGSKAVTPEAFSRPALKAFIAEQRKILKDSTLKSSLPTLSIILDYGVEHGLLTVNPLRGPERLWRAQAAAEVDPFTPSQIRAVLASAVAVDPDFGALVGVMAATGVRLGEALALRRCDLNLEHGQISVEGSWSHNRRGPTKTRKTRMVVFHNVVEPPTAVGARLRGMKVMPADPEGRIWDFSENYFRRRWYRALKGAGLATRKPHALRHSFASILLSRGVNLLKVQKAGGWRSASVMLSTYSKWIGEEERLEQAGEQAAV